MRVAFVDRTPLGKPFWKILSLGKRHIGANRALSRQRHHAPLGQLRQENRAETVVRLSVGIVTKERLSHDQARLILRHRGRRLEVQIALVHRFLKRNVRV